VGIAESIGSVVSVPEVLSGVSGLWLAFSGMAGGRVMQSAADAGPWLARRICPKVGSRLARFEPHRVGMKSGLTVADGRGGNRVRTWHATRWHQVPEAGLRGFLAVVLGKPCAPFVLRLKPEEGTE
jgi:hypothetical protein